MSALVRQLTASLLLIAVLILPLHAAAQEQGAAGESCVCQPMAAEHPASEGAAPQGEIPCTPDSTGDCCDSQECGCDLLAAAPQTGIAGNFPPTPLFPAERSGCLPKVYLAIFVPPES